MGDGETYTVRQVKALLGLTEQRWQSHGHRTITALDLLSWATDPGSGNLYYHHAAIEEGDPDAWMALRGPLAPDSEEALLLFDFFRAVRRLRGQEARDLQNHAIVALTVMGFDFAETAEVLRIHRRTVERRVLGQEVYEQGTGRALRRWPGGPLVRQENGLVHRLTAEMNRGGA